ncbi:MAG TPA: GNAT family protein [Phycisphaerales bacterium]|nr:GNAT family protein [Phycisphaerales bacterium]
MLDPVHARPYDTLAIGPRLILRHPNRRDREAYLALRRASRAFLEPWEPLPPPGGDAFGDDQFARLLDTCDTDLSQRTLACLRDGGAIIGQVSLGGILRGPLQSCFVGYWIGEQFIRRGYGTEAVGLAVRFAFGALGLHRVEANIQPHNEASKALARRVGFRYEGYSPRYLQIAGQWADHERWAISVEDWTAAAKPTR